VIKVIADGQELPPDERPPLYIAEGEKDVESLVSLGINATCCPGGCGGGWRDEFTELLRGADRVRICADNDPNGILLAHNTAASFSRIGMKDVKVLTFSDQPAKSDVSDWLASTELSGLTKDDQRRKLFDLVAKTELWTSIKQSSCAPLPAEVATGQSIPSVRGLVADALRDLSEGPSRDDVLAAVRSLGHASNLSEIERKSIGFEISDQLKRLGVSPEEARAYGNTWIRMDTAPSHSKTTEQQGSTLVFPDIAPWPDPVDGSELLSAFAERLGYYIVLPTHASEALALWALLTYCMESVSHAVRLALLSPTRECGKTRCLTVLAGLVSRPLNSSSITPAALFRSIEAYAPTLLLDEMDNARLGDNDELRALLNSGHSRASAYALRTVGENHEPKRFSTWCPIAMAAIGRLPDTVRSRAICVPLQRKPRGLALPRLREERFRIEMEPFRRQAVRWAQDHGPALRNADPDLPTAIDGREADNWEPLIAIADEAGGEWPERVRCAAMGLRGSEPAGELGELLLADLRDMFELKGCDRMASADIVAELLKLEDRPWAEFGKSQRSITPVQLAKHLRPFEIKPGNVRIGSSTPKGYLRSQFEDGWTRYLTPQRLSDSFESEQVPAPSTPHRHNAHQQPPERALQGATDASVVAGHDLTSASPDGACGGVAASEDAFAVQELLDRHGWGDSVEGAKGCAQQGESYE